eukprot:TRINITY_DN3012_c0_g1_i1.p1 TRINITY_DN3012_c0_g1~~TRINITY_DN3012_c0_g1_i1.p1  ORF type:complete len:2150 (+),score=766.00 TRINITY_DN3012_c0_g1_i1:196-6645(+)
MESYSKDGSMNGDVPSVPITTLAGLASLTHLLPELPLPGPLPGSNSSPGSSLLFHPRVEEEAKRILASQDPVLALRLAEALSSTQETEFLDLVDKTVDQASPVNHPLALQVLQQNPNAFGSSSSDNHWNPVNHVNNSVTSDRDSQPQFSQNSDGFGMGGQVMVDAGKGVLTPPKKVQNRTNVIQKRTENNHNMLNGNGSSGSESGSTSPAKSSLRHVRKHDAMTQPPITNSFKIPKVSKNEGPGTSKSFKVDVAKLSKEDEALMQKSLKEFKVGGSTTSYNNFSPRARKKDQSRYKERSDSESSEDDEGNPKMKSKFFKHTEKERNDEKQKHKEQKRSRRGRGGGEEDEYNPGEDLKNVSDIRGGKKRRRREESEGSSEEEDEESASWLKKRKRNDSGPSSPPPDLDNYVPKKVTKKIERKVLPIARKLDTEELMESSNFKRFNKTMEAIFDTAEEVNMAELDDDGEDEKEIPTELLVPKYQASELASEAAKLKSLSAMEQIPVDRLVKLLSILSWNIKDGSSVVPIANGDEEDDEQDDDKLFLELAAERVNRAADCAICAMNIMTSHNMNKRVYVDDVIDRIAQFIRYQLQKTIYPSFDPVYKELSKNKDAYIGSMKKKRNYAPTVRDKKIIHLYNRCHEIVSLMGELVHIQLLTDTTVLHLSTMGVAPFFVENIPELQLSALKMVTGVFAKYDKHRKLVLDDILASIARLPQTKRSLRTYRLNKSENIQMLTALVLQLIQCVIALPDKMGRPKEDPKKKKDEEANVEEEIDDEPIIDRDVHVNNKYESAMATAVQFLTVFLKKCGSKSEDIDYRPLFENFLQDLLTTVNTPEWPAAELLLSLLGKLLVSKFANKGTELSLRISSLDYLGVVAARLRKDAVQSKLKMDMIDTIIDTVKEAESENGDIIEDPKFSKLDPEEQRTRFLQRVLLDFLTVSGGEDDPSTLSSRHFYISQWYRDSNAEIKRQKGLDKPRKKEKQEKRKSRRGKADSESESEDDEEEEVDPKTDPKMAEVFKLTEARKDYLVSKICPFGPEKNARAGSVVSHIDSTSATLIVKYLSSKRPFFNSFDIYLKQILSVLTETSVQVRSKALKCMALVVQEDPSVLSRDDMQRGVNYSFLDSATMVREAAVDLVGKFILHKEELIDKYFDMLLLRILDTGVSVRKRVIKILKEICLEFPDYPRIPEICVKMIRRINDEEGIRNLVMEVFKNMWFVPLTERRRSEKEQHLLITKAQNITDVVVACKDTGLEWFEQLLQTLFKPKEDKDDATKVIKEPPKVLVLACQQIVDCLMESVLKSEEQNIATLQMEAGDKPVGQSHRIVACLTTTFLFAKSRPQLLVNHVQTLQPYLNVKCQTQGDYQIISNVARTLELTVPLIEHPSEIFLSQLEEASVKLILLHDKTVVSACLSCLGSVVNNVTKNYTLIRDCFKKYFGHLNSFKKVHEKDPADPRLAKATPFFRRSLFTVGLLLRHFDFTQEDLYTGLEWGSETKMAVFEAIYYFMDHESPDIQNATLQALGSICIRHYDLMMDDRLKQRYISILTSHQHATHHKIQVLNNIETYLSEEEFRMMQLDKQWKTYADKEDLKEMGDVTSGMASTVIQVFLNSVLDSFVHHSVQVRHAALKVIQLILAQGLVHPVQIVPYLICMSTDMEQRVSHTADKELQDIEKKYPGFIHMKLMKGIRLSFQLQEVLQKAGGGPLRGFRTKEGELPTALNGFLYSCLRSTKSQRRAILMNLLKQFDDTARTSLTMMLYLADNLAYIPYTVVDEPLFLIHHIDIMVSVIGSNVLQSIKESLQLPPEYEIKVNPETRLEEIIYDEDLDDDPDSVMSRLPTNMTMFVENITTGQGCLLLLVLREHLKELYAINETKIAGYSPSEAQKIYERAVNRKTSAKFNPKAVVEILKLGEVDPEGLNDDAKKDLINKYLGFKELMFKIEKDEEEYDDDGNVIPQGPQLNARDLQNMGMPTLNPKGPQNGFTAPPPPDLPPGVKGRPEHYNPVIRIQNVPLSSLPNHLLPDNMSNTPSTRSNNVAPVPETGGYLDPETGQWVMESSSKRSSRSSSPRREERGRTPDKRGLNNTQESQKVPKLTINLAPKKPTEHAFFAEMDKTSKERDARRMKHHKPHKEKHKKKKKKKHYQSDSEDSDSDMS